MSTHDLRMSRGLKSDHRDMLEKTTSDHVARYASAAVYMDVMVKIVKDRAVAESMKTVTIKRLL